MARWRFKIHGLHPLFERMHDEGYSDEVRDQMVAILKTCPLYDEDAPADADDCTDWVDAVNELAVANKQDFDDWIENLYDMADRHGVWIDPTS